MQVSTNNQFNTNNTDVFKRLTSSSNGEDSSIMNSTVTDDSDDDSIMNSTITEELNFTTSDDDSNASYHTLNQSTITENLEQPTDWSPIQPKKRVAKELHYMPTTKLSDDLIIGKNDRKTKRYKQDADKVRQAGLFFFKTHTFSFYEDKREADSTSFADEWDRPKKKTQAGDTKRKTKTPTQPNPNKNFKCAPLDGQTHSFDHNFSESSLCHDDSKDFSYEPSLDLSPGTPKDRTSLKRVAKQVFKAINGKETTYAPLKQWLELALADIQNAETKKYKKDAEDIRQAGLRAHAYLNGKKLKNSDAQNNNSSEAPSPHPLPATEHADSIDQSPDVSPLKPAYKSIGTFNITSNQEIFESEDNGHLTLNWCTASPLAYVGKIAVSQDSNLWISVPRDSSEQLEIIHKITVNGIKTRFKVTVDFSGDETTICVYRKGA